MGKDGGRAKKKGMWEEWLVIVGNRRGEEGKRWQKTSEMGSGIEVKIKREGSSGRGKICLYFYVSEIRVRKKYQIK